MCMGDIGTPSRILGPKFGAPFTYATFHHERALAPGQLSYDQMVNVYRHNSISRRRPCMASLPIRSATA